jgi:hypothetical protein
MRSQQKPFSWAKPACFELSSSNFYCIGSHTVTKSNTHTTLCNKIKYPHNTRYQPS